MSTTTLPTAESLASVSSSGRAMAIFQTMARVAALLAIFSGFGFKIWWDGNGWVFFHMDNVENIVMQSAVYAMAGLGMTMVIITGGIDLAAGSTIALSMVVAAMVLKADDGHAFARHPATYTALAVVCGTLVAAGVGCVQGLLINGLRLVPFIVTLGGMVAIRGFTKWVANNQEISPDDNWLSRNLMFPVQGMPVEHQMFWARPISRAIAGVTGVNVNPALFPVGVWATLALTIFSWGLLTYTKLGRRIYAVGSNEATARLCGVPVQWTKVQVYAIAGAFAGLAGVLEFSKINMGQPTGAMSYELYVIAACVIGGTSLKGGVGTVGGTVIGALIIGTLNAGTGQVGWAKSVQEMVIGGIIVIAVALDQLRNRKAR